MEKEKLDKTLSITVLWLLLTRTDGRATITKTDYTTIPGDMAIKYSMDGDDKMTLEAVGFVSSTGKIQP